MVWSEFQSMYFHPCHKRLHNVNLNSAYLKLRPGLNLNLRTYQPRQRVCHSGCWWILCMTPKRKSWGVLFQHLFMKGFDLWMFLCFMPCQTKTQKTWSWYLGLVFFRKVVDPRPAPFQWRYCGCFWDQGWLTTGIIDPLGSGTLSSPSSGLKTCDVFPWEQVVVWNHQ